jgi:hypothetical protein
VQQLVGCRHQPVQGYERLLEFRHFEQDIDAFERSQYFVE